MNAKSIRCFVAKNSYRLGWMWLLLLVPPMVDVAPFALGEWDMLAGVGNFTWANFPLSVLKLVGPGLVIILLPLWILEARWRRTSRWRSAVVASYLFFIWFFAAQSTYAEYLSFYGGNTWLTWELWAAFLLGWGGWMSVLAFGLCVWEYKRLQNVAKCKSDRKFA